MLSHSNTSLVSRSNLENDTRTNIAEQSQELLAQMPNNRHFLQCGSNSTSLQALYGQKHRLKGYLFFLRLQPVVMFFIINLAFQSGSPTNAKRIAGFIITTSILAWDILAFVLAKSEYPIISLELSLLIEFLLTVPAIYLIASMSYDRSHIPYSVLLIKGPSDYEFAVTVSLSLLIGSINIVHIIHGFKAYPKYRRYKKMCRTVKPRLRVTPDGSPIAVLIVPPIYADADNMERLSWDSLQEWEDVAERS